MGLSDVRSDAAMTRRIVPGCFAVALLFAFPVGAQVAPFADEIMSFEVEDEIYPAAGCETLFVGSSSFRFWFRMQQDFASRTVLKRGFGGASIADINHYFDKIVGRYRPRQIVLYAGENDINSGKPVASILADFLSFLDRKNSVMGATPVFFVSIKPSIARANDFALQTDLNSRVARLADQRDDLIYIDIVKPMLRDGKPKPELFISDQLHMNELGYAIWRERIARALVSKKFGKAVSCSALQAVSRRKIQ
jgi:lysophospholipase L1-like esterase